MVVNLPKLFVGATCFLALFAFGDIATQGEVFVDVGACPGEGCRYGEVWVATEPVDLRQAADASSEVVATIQAGRSVQTLTGQVHTVPGYFVVHQLHNEFTPGDEVLLYTYLGEGWFRLRHNGEIKELDLNFSPWGGSGGTQCGSETRCWGSLREKLAFDWWVRVRAESGVEGWVWLEQGVLLDTWRHDTYDTRSVIVH